MHSVHIFDLKKIGLDKKTGLLRYSARIVIKDEVTKRVVCDTTASKILADSITEAKAKAEAHAEQKRLSLDNGKPVRGDKLTIAAAWALWIATILRAGTRGTWESVGNARVLPAMGERYVHAVTPQEWREYFQRERLSGISEEYARQIRSTVQSFYGWCVDSKIGRVAVNPIGIGTAFGKRKAKEDPEAMRLRLKASREEDKRKWLELPELPKFLAVYAKKFPETYVLWLVMCCVGLRYAEAAALEPDAFDFSDPEKPRLHVYQTVSRGVLGPPKGNDDRWIDVPPFLVGMIETHMANRRFTERTYRGATHCFVFPCLRVRDRGRVPVVSYQAMRQHVNAAKRLAGIRSANATHLARHTSALLTASLPGTLAQRQLGHKHLAQTLSYGANPRGVVGQAIQAQVAPMLPAQNVVLLHGPRRKR